MVTAPTVCNLCGGPVEFISNDKIYGRRYGSGFAYRCAHCGAYTGTHRPRPKEALGLLADAEMRRLKVECHALFDARWANKAERSRQYKWLADRMGIPASDCHFGWFKKEQLLKAREILIETCFN